jgi:hypothetical protein
MFTVDSKHHMVLWADDSYMLLASSQPTQHGIVVAVSKRAHAAP